MADFIIYEHSRTIFFEQIVSDGTTQQQLRCRLVVNLTKGTYTVNPIRNTKHRGFENIGVLLGQLADKATEYAERLIAEGQPNDGQLKLPLEHD